MTSATYKENIYKNERVTVPEVMYSLTAPDSKDGGETTLPPGNPMSRPEQIINEIRPMNAPIASFEPGYWRLDGTFVLPVPPSASNIEVGWWSADMSDENGVLPVPLVIERVFDNVQTFSAVGLTFDAASDNYCTDFEVSLYDAFDNLIYNERIADNDASYSRTEKAGADILRVVVTLYKTNNPFRYARVIEIDFGIMLEYGNHVIQSISLIREADADGKSFPLPELSVRILNNGLYDQLDSSTYAPYFQKRQRFDYRHGLVLPSGGVEWQNCGTYYLSNWNVSDRTVEFNATGRAAMLENSVYFGSSFQEFTIGQLANRVVPQQVHITLESPRITGYFGNVDYRRLVSMLAELSCCLVYEDKNNAIVFDDILAKKGGSVDTLNYKNILRKPSVTLKEYYNAINLTEYTASTEHHQISKTEQQPGEITIYFNSPIVGEPEIEVSPGFKLSNIIIYTMYLTATLTGSGTAEVIISGQSVTLTKSETLYRAPWHPGREPDSPYKVDIPCMIHTEHYQAFRDWFLERKFKLLNMRLSTDAFWVQNPEREIGDMINAQLRDNGSNANMFITRQEMSFPALKGNTKLLGNVVMR